MNNINVGDLVICINAVHRYLNLYLTLNKRYFVIDIDYDINVIRVKSDSGDERGYNISRFKLDKKYIRKLKLNKIYGVMCM